MGYYQGDYYAGDPGFFSLIGRAIKGLAGFGGGTKTVIQAAAPTVLPGVGTAIARRLPGIIVQRGGKIVRRVGGAIAKHPVLTAAGAAGAIGAAAGAGVEALEAPRVAMRGFHISPRTGALVKNRRMRVTNPRALRRAIRRATGFARLARRVLHFTSPRAPRGRAIFKTRRRGVPRMRG